MSKLRTILHKEKKGKKRTAIKQQTTTSHRPKYVAYKDYS